MILNVAMVNRFVIEGGKGVAVKELSKALVKMGHDVTLIPRYQGMSSIARYISQFAKKFDVIHVHEFDPPALASAVFASKMYGIGIFCTIHQFGPPSWYKDSVMRPVMRASLRNFDALISVSNSIRRDLVGFVGEDPPKVVTIYNGVDTSVFDPSLDPRSLQQRLGIEGKLVILYVGRLIPRKGVSDLLEALREVRNRIHDVVLIVCGRGVMRLKLEDLVSSLGLEGNVIFAGFVPEGELPLYYAASDIVVVPSISEPMGIVLLEAMSMQKPIIATNVGGIPEIVRDGHTALIVPPRNPKEISLAILRLWADKDLAHRLTLNGRELVERRFSWDMIARETFSLYIDTQGSRSS